MALVAIPSSTSFLENRFYTHSCFECFATAGEQLCSLMWTGVNHFLQSFKYPYETISRTICRVAEVVKRFFQCAFGVVLTFVGFIPAFFGVCCFAISNFGKREFTWIRPEKAEPLPVPQQLVITTHNLCAFTDFIGTFSGLPPLGPRMENWIERVLEKPQATCICLQELGSRYSIEQITTKCKEKYPYMIVDVASKTLGIGSGLGLLSAYPIEEPMFWPLPDFVGVDRVSNRGVLAAVLRLAPKVYVVVVTTHLQARDGDGKTSAARAAQMKCLEKIYRVYVEHLDQKFVGQKRLGVFTAADFNVGAYLESQPSAVQNPEWESAPCQRFFSQVNHRYPLPTREGTVWDLGACGTGWDRQQLDRWQRHPGAQLDHILALKEEGRDVLQGTLEVDRELGSSSDHLAMTLTVECPVT
jgi:endonuclease/exonuclease/phosphatase family metal-dependent hydrolase